MMSITKKGSIGAKVTQSRKEEGLSASERGRQAYAQKDYESALEAFSEAIEVSTEHLLLNALDNRAATLEKLDRLRAALRDARQMIEIMPKFAKGYLRCGKILQLSKHNDLAMQIYERGLKKVKITTDPNADKHRTILQDQYNKLRRAMNPKKTLDPLAYLPLELAVMVCKHLAMRDRVICLAVSKSWRHLLEHTPDLWTTLDTSYCRKPMSMKSLKIHLRRSKYTVDFARITMKAQFDTARMHFLTKCCKELRELRIEGVGMIGESLSEPIEDAKKLQSLYVSDKTEVSLGTVQSCTRKCQSIVDMTCLRVKGSGTILRQGAWPKNENVQRLELHADKEGRFERRSQLDIIPLMNQTPNLISAILPQWKVVAIAFDLEPWKFLQTLDLTNTQITQFPRLPATLKHLTLSDNPLLTIRSQEELLALTVLPLLETFNCHTTALDATHVMHITSEAITKRNLKKLYIGGRMNATEKTPVEQEFPSSETVEELSLACLLLTDRRALQIVGLFPNLRKLDMSNTKITGVAVKEFVEKGITSLKLNECDEISTDAIEWARGKGISVEYKFPSQAVAAQGFAALAAASGP